MDEQLQLRAKVLAFSLYDAIPQLPDIDQPTEGFERPRYLAGNIEFSVMGGHVSRAISWVEDGVQQQLWFEVRGWVHFTRGDQPNSELYVQSIFDDWPKDDPNPRSDTFEGGHRLFHRMRKQVQRRTRSSTTNSGAQRRTNKSGSAN